MSTIQILIDNWIDKRNTYYKIKSNLNITQTELDIAINDMNEAKTNLDNEIDTKPIIKLIKQLIALHYF